MLKPVLGVEESVVLNFYNDQEQNLVTTSVNILSIYRVRPDDNDPSVKRLELTDEYELWGNICSICRVRFNGATKDSVLLSFEEAKCSIVEYEAETGGLHTVSMHFFQEDMLKRGFRKMNSMPLARVDAYQRCASVLIYGKYLAILPFRRSHTGTGVAKSHAVSSFMINVEDLPRKMASVIDFQFLDG